MEDLRRSALYARVSSHGQTGEMTIESQIVALKQRIQADGGTVAAELIFRDEGYSGGTLQRPALERLRDLAYAGGLDRLYVHSPDRLARQFVHHTLLLEELAIRRVEVVFLNQAFADVAQGA